MAEARFELCDTAGRMKALARAISSLGDEGCISLDTEFERTRTLVPKAAVVQLRFDGETYLADPVSC
ncbi:MAG: hypothetical protein ACI4NA_04430, partial [Succinivibrio sp.]